MSDPAGTQRHPAFFTVPSLLLIGPLCVVGAIIGVELITTLGITTNTALIGALAGMSLARLPLAMFAHYRSPHMQNLAQTAISASTFGAGNALLLPIGIPFVMGRPDLVGPMLLGVFLAMLVDGYLLYRLFDSEVFPAEAAWPPGVAAAEVIRADDASGRGGEHGGAWLLLGLGVGIIGAIYRVPMSAFGVAMIGNIWALAMFGAGLLLRGHSDFLFGWLTPGGDLMRAHVPHGVMVGAGLAALIQVAMLIRNGRPASGTRVGFGQLGPALGSPLGPALGLGTGAYLAIALLLALFGGLYSALPPGMLLLFIVFAAFAAYFHTLIVGLAAMHTGWFPAFAVALITLLVGMLIGFPPAALCLLVGFSAATGPSFASLGYSFKAGHILRGDGANPVFERDGRKHQLFAAMFAFGVAGAVVWLTHDGFFAADRVAPAGRVYVAAINAGASSDVAWQLAIWAIPGALIQFAGGPSRQLGVLLATGLMVLNPAAGWAVVAGIALRGWLMKRTAGRKRGEMEVFAAGVIAGDALHSLFDAASRVLAAKR